MIPAEVDWSDRAVHLIPTQFYALPRWRAFFDAMASTAGMLDGLVSDLLDQRLMSSTGAALDQWGDLAAVDREGLSDGEYRLVILGSIAALRSDSDPYSLAWIAMLLTGASSAQAYEYYPAAITIEVDGVLVGDAFSARIRRILETARPGGVRLDLVVGGAPSFTFDTAGQGFDEGRFARLI